MTPSLAYFKHSHIRVAQKQLCAGEHAAFGALHVNLRCCKQQQQQQQQQQQLLLPSP